MGPIGTINFSYRSFYRMFGFRNKFLKEEDR